MSLFSSDLKKYTDWYLRVGEVDKSHGCIISNGRPVKIKACEDEKTLFLAQSLLDICGRFTDEDFRMDLYDTNFRGHIINSVSGTVITLRQMPSSISSLEELGIPQFIRNKLLAKSPLKNGLLLIGGAQGQGKSTTTAAILKERLELHGGHALTVENPIEMPLDGWHGDGICIQTQMNSSSSFAEEIRGAMRSYPVGQPGILMIGEIRDSETAIEACIAAVNGLLVLSTIHANNPLDIFSRMESLAKASLDTEEVRTLLSSGFRMLIHQEIVRGKLKVQTLNVNDAVTPHIKSGNYEMLSTEFQSQAIKRKLS